MVRLSLWTTVVLLTVPLPGYAADLGKIDGTLRKEPAYQAKPKYCLVVLGPEAKTRVWLVLDGDVLYADRNGDGDLTSKDERFSKTHSLQEVFQFDTIPARPGDVPFSLKVEVKPGREGQETRYQISCKPQKGKGFSQRTDGVLLFADKPREAPVVHFGGPLTRTILDWHKPLQRRRLRRLQDNELSILVGTPVLGGKHEAFATVYQSFRELAGGESFPVVEVRLPGKDPGARPILTRAAVRH
jgi:hypothetical protein